MPSRHLGKCVKQAQALATVKVAAAVQVEGAAVQVAGRCASGMQATVQVEQAHVVLARPTAS